MQAATVDHHRGSGRPRRRSAPGSGDRIISDHLGSPRLIIDLAMGNVVWKTRYDEFGVEEPF
jgi:hypothetical protein